MYRSHYCTATSKSEPATVVIKKYGNRRLYDTAGSRYVNLDDIEQATRKDAQGGTCSRTGARIDMKRTLLSAGRRRDLDGGRAVMHSLVRAVPNRAGLILAGSKRLLVLVGQKKALGIAVRNDRPQRRYSGLLASLKVRGAQREVPSNRKPP